MKDPEPIEKIVNPGEVEIPEDYVNSLSNDLQMQVEDELRLREKILKDLS